MMDNPVEDGLCPGAVRPYCSRTAGVMPFSRIQPEFGSGWFDDVNIRSVNGSDAAQGRLTVGHDLVWGEHGLLSGGGEACLPGKFGNEVPDAIMSSCVQAFGAACSMASIWVKNAGALFAPRGDASNVVPGAGYPSL